MSVTLDQLDFIHPNGLVALKRIHLQVRAGEHVALIGPSGAGKTTLLSVIGARLLPTRGQVTVLDQAVDMQAEHSLRLLRPRIGSIYQSPPLPARQRVVTAVLAGRLGVWPVWKSLASLVYPWDIAGAAQVLSQVQLSDKLFDRCDQLSGGQLQRVGMARVLYQQADLVLADEPVSALDPGLAQAMLQMLQQDASARRATLITSLHAVDLALGCFPRIVGLRDGEIAFDLPAQEITQAMLGDLFANEATQAKDGDMSAAHHTLIQHPA